MFVKSITQAAIPQIMKSYGAGDTNRSINLVYVISRISSLAMLLLLVPILLCVDDILVLWLKEPPQYTSIFVIFLVINTFIAVLGSGFNASIQSTGKIRKNEVWVGIINLLTLPLMFVLYKIGLPPYINVIIMIIATFIIWVFQIYIMKQLTSFDFKKYLTGTIIPVLLTATVFYIPLFFVRMLFGNSTLQVIVFLVVTEIWGIVVIYLFGVRKNEKLLISNFVKKRIKHE
jgi:O-antigen/teichoic acid export membrane protein